VSCHALCVVGSIICVCSMQLCVLPDDAVRMHTMYVMYNVYLITVTVNRLWCLELIIVRLGCGRVVS